MLSPHRIIWWPSFKLIFHTTIVNDPYFYLAVVVLIMITHGRAVTFTGLVKCSYKSLYVLRTHI